MARQLTKGTVNHSTTIRIIDSTDGTPELSVVAATGGLDLRYRREGAVRVAMTESDLSALTDAHSDGGLLHIGNGYYRVDVPDAAFATGVDGVLIEGGVTGMVVIGEYYELLAVDPYATDFGLALTNANMAHVDSGERVAIGQWLGQAVTLSGTLPDVNVAGIDNLDAPATWKTAIQTAAAAALVAVNLDHLMGASATGANVVNDSVIAQLVSLSGVANFADFNNITMSLERIAGDALTAAGNVPPTLVDISDAIWDELTAGHVGVGSFGELMADTKTDTANLLIELGSAADTNIATDLANIAAQLPASLVDGKMDSLSVQGRTTIATLATQSDFTLAAGSADDNAYDGWLVVVVDVATSVQRAVGRILTYTGASKRVQLEADPAIFAMAVGDIVLLYADESATQNIDMWAIATRTLTALTGQPRTDLVGADNAIWANSARTLTGFTGQARTDLIGDDASIQASAGARLTKLDTVFTGIAKNVAKPDIPIFMVLASDGRSPATGLTLTITVSRDGAAFGATTGSSLEIASGAYSFDASAADLNGDVCLFKVDGTLADSSMFTIYTS